MRAKGFFASLFDYSFSSYITPRIIRVLYVLATVLVALWTLVIILLAFKASSTLGILALLIGGPIYFIVAGRTRVPQRLLPHPRGCSGNQRASRRRRR